MPGRIGYETSLFSPEPWWVITTKLPRGGVATVVVDAPTPDEAARIGIRQAVGRCGRADVSVEATVGPFPKNPHENEIIERPKKCEGCERHLWAGNELPTEEATWFRNVAGESVWECTTCDSCVAVQSGSEITV